MPCYRIVMVKLFSFSYSFSKLFSRGNSFVNSFGCNFYLRYTKKVFSLCCYTKIVNFIAEHNKR